MPTNVKIRVSTKYCTICSDQMELKLLPKFVFIKGADVVQRIEMETESLGTEGRMLRMEYVAIVFLDVRTDELDRMPFLNPFAFRNYNS